MLVNQLFSGKSLYCKSRTVSRTKRSCKKNTSQSQICWRADVHGFADTTFLRTRKHNCCDAGFTLLLRTIVSPISFFHSCSSRLWAAFPIFVHTYGHTWPGQVVVWTLVSIPPDHKYPLESFSFKRVNFVKPLQEYDKCWLESTFQWSSIRFSCMTSRSVQIDFGTSMYFRCTRNVASLNT